MQPMTPFDVIDKLARGDVYVVNVTFPEGLTIAEMADIFASHGFGPASAFVEAANDVSLIRALDPAAQNLEGYLFPDTYPLPRRADAPTPRPRDGAAIRARAHARAAQRGGGAGPLHPSGGHARIDRGKGNRARRRAADGRGRVPEPVADRHGAAVRSDGDLRAQARRNVHGQPAARRSRVRLAVQHLPVSRGCRPVRSPRRAGPRSKRRSIPPTSTICTSSAGTTARTSSRARSTSTIATFRSTRCSTFATCGRPAQVKPG